MMADKEETGGRQGSLYFKDKEKTEQSLMRPGAPWASWYTLIDHTILQGQYDMLVRATAYIFANFYLHL